MPDGKTAATATASGFKAMCRVQGSPLPDVQWVRGGAAEEEVEVLEGAPAYPLHHHQDTPNQHVTSSQLQGVQPGGQYTCAASNPLGKDQATLFIVPYVEESGGPASDASPSPLILLFSVSLGAKVALLLGMALWAAKGHLASWLHCAADT